MNISLAEALDLTRYVLMLVLQVSAPILLAGMGIGLLISILQAVTQIQEQTLTFVPKMIVMAVVAIIVSSWATTKVLDFTEAMFTFSGFNG